MKSFLVISMILLSTNSVEWLLNFEQAKEQAKESNKLIMLNFSGSDWCAPCVQFTRSVLEQPVFQNYAAQYLVLLKADFPRHKKNQLDPGQRAHNEKLAELYNAQGKFPLVVLLTPDGNVVHEWDTFQGMTAEEFVNQLDVHIHGK